MFPRNRIAQALGALLLTLIVVSTLQAQDKDPEPTPTPEPTPSCEPCIQQQIDETIALRRFLIILGGTWMGWQVCMLVYKWV